MLKISLIINLFLIGLLLFLFNNDVFNYKKNEPEHKSLIFMPYSREYPEYCTDYYQLYSEFETEPDLNILENKLHNKLNTHVCDEYYYLLGRIEEKRNNLNKAIEYYKKAAEVFPLRSYFLRIAMIYKSLGNEYEKELALDKASITIGSRWCKPNYNKNYEFLQLKGLSSSSDKVRNALTFNRPLKIKKIMDLVKKGEMESAFSEYSKIMENSFMFHYDYDRMTKLFAPYFFLEMNKKFYDNFSLSYWYREFLDKISMKKLQDIYRNHGTLQSIDSNILDYYYKLCVFGNKIARATLDFGSYGKECSKYFLAYDGFELITLMDKFNLKFDYLKFADIGNIESVRDYMFYKESKRKNWESLEPAPEKWTENIIKSF